MEQKKTYSRADFLRFCGGAALAGAAAFYGRLPYNPGKAEASEYITPVIPNKKLDFEISSAREKRSDGWSYSTYDPYEVLDFGPFGHLSEKAYPNFEPFYKTGGAADKYDRSMAVLNGKPRTNLKGLLLKYVSEVYDRAKEDPQITPDVLTSLGFCYAHVAAGLFFGDSLPENTIGGVHFTQKDLRSLLAMSCAHIFERPVDLSAFHEGELITAEVTRNFYFPVGALSADNTRVRTGYSGASSLSSRSPIRLASNLISLNSPQHPDHIKSNIKPESNPNGGWTVESQMPLWVALVYAKTPNPTPKDFESAFGGTF